MIVMSEGLYNDASAGDGRYQHESRHTAKFQSSPLIWRYEGYPRKTSLPKTVQLKRKCKCMRRTSSKRWWAER
jgi:hypothetical protein